MTHEEAIAARNKLWRGGYRVLYTATSRGPLLCLWRPADE